MRNLYSENSLENGIFVFPYSYFSEISVFLYDLYHQIPHSVVILDKFITEQLTLCL